MMGVQLSRPYPWGLLLDPVPLVPHPTLLSELEHAWTAGQRRGLPREKGGPTEGPEASARAACTQCLSALPRTGTLTSCR